MGSPKGQAHAGRAKVQRHDPSAADFYMQPSAEWVERSACVGSDPRVFFDNIEEAKMEARTLAIREAQKVCGACPVRKQCAAQVMLEEGDASEDYRYGFRAYMTPEQRVSIARRGGLNGRDPKALVEGRDGRRKVPPVPLDGDKWSRHHTTLARKLVKWIEENIKRGARLPSQAQLCKALACNPVPLRRVLDALVQDGTLDYSGPTGRGRNGTTTVYVRSRAPRKSAASWLPPHLT